LCMVCVFMTCVYGALFMCTCVCETETGRGETETGRGETGDTQGL